jgi:hypothetical protein
MIGDVLLDDGAKLAGGSEVEVDMPDHLKGEPGYGEHGVAWVRRYGSGRSR